MNFQTTRSDPAFMVWVAVGGQTRTESSLIHPPSIPHTIPHHVELHPEPSEPHLAAFPSPRHRGAVGGADRVSFAQAEAGGGDAAGGGDPGCEDADQALL